jgi:hypothetical protein
MVEIEQCKKEILLKLVKEKIERLQNLQNKDSHLIIFEICREFDNCVTCPISCLCFFYKEGCQNPPSDGWCKNCPRLRVCAKEGIVSITKEKRIEEEDKFEKHLESIGL